MAKISVIVPVYNVEKYLSKCLDSLINQDFDDYEIVIINDGSPDNSQKIIEEYKEKYPKRILSFIKQNEGVSIARNYGISKSSGEYICFVDSDDYVTKNYLSTMYNKAVSNNYDIVIANYYKKREENIETCLGFRNINQINNKNLLLSVPGLWNKLYKREIFTKNNIEIPSNIRIGEDLVTLSKLVLKANKIGAVDEPLYYYIIREGSVTNQNKFSEKFLDIFESINMIMEYYKGNNEFENYKSELEYLTIFHLMHGLAINTYKYEEGYEVFAKINNYMNANFSNWRKNQYFKNENWKFKLVCNLISKNKIKIIRKIFKN